MEDEEEEEEEEERRRVTVDLGSKFLGRFLAGRERRV